MTTVSVAALQAERFYFAHLRRLARDKGARVPDQVLRRSLRTRLLAEERVEDGTRVTLGLEVRMTDVRVRLHAVTGEVLSWYVPVLAEASRRELPAEVLLETAASLAQPPEGAVLRVARYEDIGDQTVFVARWEHEIQGIAVEGDHLEVLVNGRSGQPFSFARSWREPEPEVGFRER